MAKAPHERTDVPVAIWETNSLADHLGVVRRQVDRSCVGADGRELRRLVGRILSGSASDTDYSAGCREAVITAWGRKFRFMPHNGSDTTECKIAAIWNFVVMNVRYERDPEGYDLFKTARVVLEDGEGDCDDFTILLCAMGRVAGFETIARVITTNGKHWSHVYAIYDLGRSRKVCLDPTVAGATPGWEFPHSVKAIDFSM